MYKEDIIICYCGDPKHQVLLQVVEDGKNHELTFTPLLNTSKNLFQRIWVSLKYIFKAKGFYYHWDTLIVSDEARQTLLAYLTEHPKYTLYVDEEDYKRYLGDKWSSNDFDDLEKLKIKAAKLKCYEAAAHLREAQEKIGVSNLMSETT